LALTNIYNLPQPLVNLFNKEKYSKGEARVSVTELIGSPRISILREANADKVQEDIIDKFWALMGTNVHRILEQGSDEDHLTEERLYKEVEGWVVSGGIDLQKLHDGMVSIIDWKFVSVMSAMAPKPDWEKQLNCYAWLVREVKKVDVKGLQVCAILRDWSRGRSETDKGYPQAPVIMLDLPLWSHDKASDYILERVSAHKDARRSRDWNEEVPHCTDEETWLRPSSYAVYRSGGKRAIRVFPDRVSAEGYISNQEATGLRIDERPGTRVRCAGNYCGVRSFCSQYQALSSPPAGGGVGSGGSGEVADPDS